jgi:hypothetical protein
MKSYLEQTFISEFFAIELIKKLMNTPTLSANHHTVSNTNSPIDFSLADITFDVKCASPTLVSATKKQKVWDFDLKHLKQYCDYIILIGLIDDTPQRVFLIPSNDLSLRHIRISIVGQSKWHAYGIWQGRI